MNLELNPNPAATGEAEVESISNLMDATGPSLGLSGETRAAEAPSGFCPAVPGTVEALGLTEGVLEQLIFKIIHFRGDILGRELANAVGVKFSLIERIIDQARRQRQVDVKGSSIVGAVSSVYTLSEAGRARAREFLEVNQYAGPAPVPMDQYKAAVRAQRLKSGWLTKNALQESFKDIIFGEDVFRQIGPAVNSGKSFLLYGKPGNGKTYLAESFFKLESAPIYVPYAIEYQGQIIQLFDPVYHKVLDQGGGMQSALSMEPKYDQRWLLTKRPFIVTGGELTLDMLDLTYISSAKIYDAPFQLKANNGIYLLDDFGRQRATPAEILNRWIVPMDRRVDFLTFQTGGKAEIPFEAFLIFSTNLNPEQLGDEAFLRRITYKMQLRNPEIEEFAEIFWRYCEEQSLPCTEELVIRFVEKRYRLPRRPFRRCHPRDVISHAIDMIHFEQLPFELTENVLDMAWNSCFVDTSEMDE